MILITNEDFGTIGPYIGRKGNYTNKYSATYEIHIVAKRNKMKPKQK
jgi:hypothetical protein